MFSYFDLSKVGQLWLGVDGIREWVGDILTALLEAKNFFISFFATNECVFFHVPSILEFTITFTISKLLDYLMWRKNGYHLMAKTCFNST